MLANEIESYGINRHYMAINQNFISEDIAVEYELVGCLVLIKIAFVTHLCRKYCDRFSSDCASHRSFVEVCMLG